MVFECLYDSLKRGELLLVEGGMCRWHLRRDGQLTLLEILSTHRGAGRRMIEALRQTPGAVSLFAKCPQDLPANGFYRHMGFVLEAETMTNSGRAVCHWRLPLAQEQVHAA